MNTSRKPMEPLIDMQALAEALSDMRDRWVEVSLMLKDIQFDSNPEQRQAAADYLRDLVDKVNLR